MTTYENKLYEFLTKEENFEPFYDMKEQFDKIKGRLIEDFWIAVNQRILALSDAEMSWRPKLDAPNGRNRKLKMGKGNGDSEDFNAAVVYEWLNGKVVLGAWFNRALIGELKMQDIFTKAVSFIKSADLRGWTAGKGSWWFGIYQETGDNFENKYSLLKILPGERDSLVESYAQNFMSAVQNLSPFCISNSY